MTSYLGFGFPGGWELWIILAIFLLLFGHRIPGMARAMGSGIVEFKKGLKDPGDDGDQDGGTGDPAGGSADSGSTSGSTGAGKQTQDSGSAKG
jgi:sec-independent protein translocase protein TatA